MLIMFIIILFILLFYIKFRNYVPVLMYHRIASISNDRNALPKEKFQKQLNYLKRKKFTTITMQEIYNFYERKIPLPKNPILLTFDDAYADNFELALPLLKKYNMTASVFPIANWIGKDNKWENFHKSPTKTMSLKQLYKWKESGLEIGSHTLNHPFLSHNTSEVIYNELYTSKIYLEEKINIKVDFLCYPYGDFNDEVIKIAKQAGYIGAFAIFDHVPLWKINPYALPRIPIPSTQKMWEFKLKTSSLYILFLYLRQWERNIKRYIRRK